MKESLLIIIALLLGIAVGHQASTKTLTTGYKVDLPEEIQIAKVGDSLTVYRVSDGIIYLGFKH